MECWMLYKGWRYRKNGSGIVAECNVGVADLGEEENVC